MEALGIPGLASQVIRDVQRDELVLPIEVFQFQGGDGRQGFRGVGSFLDLFQARGVFDNAL